MIQDDFQPICYVTEMKNTQADKPNSIPTKLIAPCGMNCRLCSKFNRDKNTCPGCRADESLKPKTNWICKILTCEKYIEGNLKYCFECNDFPCSRLYHLDKRYRTNYGMSMIDNLNSIQSIGIREFIENEIEKWRCPDCGDMICVHKPVCMYCNYKWR